ncbi:MAG: acyltransferase [Thermoanaerobaculia bacterium]
MDSPSTPQGRSTGEHYDLLRVLAAFMVFAGHQKALTGLREPDFLGFVSWGEVAVGVFFALSGYLVSESWRRDPSVARYLLRRGLRLLPGLAGVVLFACLLLGPILTSLQLGTYFSHPQTYQYLWNLLLNVRFALPGVFATNPVPNVMNGSLWTLPMEVACYLVLVLFLRSLARIRAVWILWPLAAALWTTDFLVAKETSWVLYSTSWRMAAHFATYFFIGAALRLAPPPRFSPIPAAMLAAAVLMFTANSRLGYWCAPLCVALLVIGAARLSAAPSRWVSRYGDLSYGLYLYAFPIQQLVISTGLARDYPRRGFVVAWLGIVLCAYLSWRWIESPALRFKPRRRNGTTRA